MTTHDRDKVIAAAKEAGADFQCETLLVNGKDADDFIINFYAIAFDAGRQAEREDCAKEMEKNSWLLQSADAIRIRSTK